MSYRSRPSQPLQHSRSSPFTLTSLQNVLFLYDYQGIDLHPIISSVSSSQKLLGLFFISLGNAPLSRNILSSATFHRPFRSMNPPISNSFQNLLFPFLVILFPSFNLPIPCILGRDPAVFKELNSFQHLAMLFCAHLLRPAAVNQFVPFQASHSPSIFCTQSKLLPACLFFLPNRDLQSDAVSIPKISRQVFWSCAFSWHLHVLAASSAHASILVGLSTPLRSRRSTFLLASA